MLLAYTSVLGIAHHAIGRGSGDESASPRVDEASVGQSGSARRHFLLALYIAGGRHGDGNSGRLRGFAWSTWLRRQRCFADAATLVCDFACTLHAFRGGLEHSVEFAHHHTVLHVNDLYTLLPRLGNAELRPLLAKGARRDAVVTVVVFLLVSTLQFGQEVGGRRGEGRETAVFVAGADAVCLLLFRN